MVPKNYCLSLKKKKLNEMGDLIVLSFILKQISLECMDESLAAVLTNQILYDCNNTIKVR